MTKEQAQRLDTAIAKYNEVSETPMYWWDVTAKITDFNNAEEIDAAIEVIEKMIAELSKEEAAEVVETEAKTEKKKMRALGIYVYRDDALGDCTNGGISSKFDRLLLVCEDGNIEIDENNPPENLVVIAEGFRGYKYIRPYKDADQVGWMSGGNIGYSCDTRFRRLSEYPLKIHDRQETQEMYDRLSN